MFVFNWWTVLWVIVYSLGIPAIRWINRSIYIWIKHSWLIYTYYNYFGDVIIAAVVATIVSRVTGCRRLMLYCLQGGFRQSGFTRNGPRSWQPVAFPADDMIIALCHLNNMMQPVAKTCLVARRKYISKSYLTLHSHVLLGRKY